MKAIFSALMSACLLAVSLDQVAGGPLEVDESRFLEKSFDFCPPSEKSLDEAWLRPPEKPYPFPLAKYEVEKGLGRIVIGGVAVPSFARTVLGVTGAPVERLLRESGVRLFIVDVSLTADYFEKRLLSNAPNDAFAQFEKRASELIKAVPDALIFVRLWITNVNEDYVESYPDGLLAGENGETDWGGTPRPPQSGHTRRPNMLNDWKRYCGEHLYRFLHRLGESEYATRVGGFCVGAMNTGEWWYYKGKGDPGWDYSASRKEAFERFVLAKYGNDPERVAKAWGRPHDEHLLKMPTLAEREVRPIAPNSPSLDYLEVLNMPVTNAAIYFAEIIKAATGGRSLVGMELHIGGMTYATNGTVFLNHLLDSPAIDFFGGPSEYRGRGPGSSPLYRAIYSSLARHGKFWVNEGDFRTHMAYDTRPGAVGEATMTPGETNDVFAREYARGVVFNYMHYFMDFAWHWYHDVGIKESVTRLLGVDRFLREVGVKRAPEIAIVTDQESQLFANYFANPTSLMLDGNMDKIGAPWDFYELRDFLAPGVADPFKLIIFLNCRALSDHEREEIDKLKAKGRVIVWMHDPGVVDLTNKGKDPAKLLSDLIEMQMKAGSEPSRIKVDVGAFSAINAPLDETSSELPEEEIKKTETNREVSVSDASPGLLIGNVPSRYYCVDASASILGRDSAGRGFLAARAHDEWTSVYVAHCRIPPGMVRAFAKMAGCHIWNHSGEIVFAAENLLAIHATTGGDKVVKLPKRSGVFDLLSGLVVADDTNELKLPMKMGETRFFYLGDASEAAGIYKETVAAHRGEIAKFSDDNPAPMVGPVFFSNHKPNPPKEVGAQPLTGLKRLQPPAVLVAGPFPSDQKDIDLLDSQLSEVKEIAMWYRLPLTKSTVSNQSDKFLQVVHPLALVESTDGGVKWYGVHTAFSWLSQEKLGMSTGQSYAVAFFLESSVPTKVRLRLDTVGESIIWVDSKQTNPESVIDVNGERKLVVIRVKGDAKPTGLGIKIFDAKPNSIRERLSPPETVVSWIPPEAP